MEVNYTFEHLFKPLKIGGLTIKNRYILGPMGNEAIYGPEGEFNDLAADYFCERAAGGYGLLYSGARWVDNIVDEGFPRPVVLSNPWKFKNYGIRLSERVHTYGAKMFIQCSAGIGRASIGCCTPSGTPCNAQPDKPTKIPTTDEIKKKVDLMVEAAALMKRCEFDGVEIHSMHASHFLDLLATPEYNRRTDEYGGSLENRMRAVKEMIQGIKQVNGSGFPVTIRLGLRSFINNGKGTLHSADKETGRTVEEGLEIAKMLEDYGCDAINLDVGTFDSLWWAAPTAYSERGLYVPFSEAVKQVVDIPVFIGGKLDDPAMAEEVVSSGKADAIIVARGGLADSQYVNKVMAGTIQDIRPCINCYVGCLGHALRGAETQCAVNPSACRSREYALTKTTEPKHVVVIGGGIAGMEAARTAKICGHQVEVYEKSHSLGGLMIPAGKHDFKDDINRLNRWYQRELKKLEIPVYLNCEMTPKTIKDKHADAVILAVGSRPTVPPIPGVDSEKVMTAVEALTENRPTGRNTVVVGGGLVGAEFALALAREGKHAVIVEMQEDILKSGWIPIMSDMHLRALLEDEKVEIHTGTKILRITEKGLEAARGEERFVIEADTIILSAGMKPYPSMASNLIGCGAAIYEIGDGRQVGTIDSAIRSAYELVRNI